MHSRRNFIRQLSGAGLLTCCGISWYSCANIRYIYLSGELAELKINKSDFGEHSFIIVKHDKLLAPLYLTKTEKQNYHALQMFCTHKGCEVRPVSNYLLCPCHGSEFSNSGMPTKPPATEPLKQYPIKTDETYIYIYIS